MSEPDQPLALQDYVIASQIVLTGAWALIMILHGERLGAVDVLPTRQQALDLRAEFEAAPLPGTTYVVERRTRTCSENSARTTYM